MDFVVAVVATLLAMRHAFLQLVMLSPPHRERHIREAPPGMRATGSMSARSYGVDFDQRESRFI